MQSQFDFALSVLLATADHPKIAIAYSGGLDSSALLHLCAAYAKRHPVQFFAFHIHHGISPNADTWVAHCRHECDVAGLPFEVAHIQLNSPQRQGIEAAARGERYKALSELCQRHEITLLLTAHHQDDQAETLLLHLLRGTGLAGLGGMRPCQRALALTGNPNLWLARPLLDCTRAELEQYVEQHDISYINDESNADTRYTRNRIRHDIMPMLAQHFPGFQTRFARTAHHLQEVSDILKKVSENDYAQVQGAPGCLDVALLIQLPPERIDHVLRYWLAQHHAKMPDTARLAEMRKQLLNASDDAQVCIQHDGVELHRYRGQLSIAKPVVAALSKQDFIWQGELSLSFPEFSGTLFFDALQAGQIGIDRAWLLKQTLHLQPRQGGERLKLASNRPSRDMKHHYQTLGIPYWQRARWPFVYVGDELLFAAGVGVDAKFLCVSGDCVGLRWQGM